MATQVENNHRIYFSSIDNPAKVKNIASAGYASFAPESTILYSTRDGNLWEMNEDGGARRQLTN